MKYPTKLSDAVHILCFIALAEDGQPLTSDAIAKSIATNASYVRQLMSLLRRGELLTSVRGHARPTLTRPPSEINLLDCYRAVEGEKPLLHQDTHTNPACGVGVNVQLALRDCYDASVSLTFSRAITKKPPTGRRTIKIIRRSYL